MSVGLKHGYYWEEKIVPPPPPVSPPSHAPHDWRAVNPRMRKLFLRGILPEDFLLADTNELNELEELMRLLDDLDNLPS